MPGSPSGSTSLGRFSSSASADSVQTNELSTYRSKGRELAQAMLSEVEDLLRGFDADLKMLNNKSRDVCHRSWSDTPLPTAELNVSASLDSCPLPSRSRQSWGARDSHMWRLPSSAVQTFSEDGGGEGTAFMTLIKNIYKMVSTDIAPRLHSVTQEVTELRKSNEMLSEKVERQRLRNDKLLEESEDLQAELRDKVKQLNEQRRVSKNLDIYEGENAMLKVELNSLRLRVEKLGGNNPPQPVAVREVEEKTEVPCKRASSNDWLKKENEELQKEVARWRTEASEKDLLINELKGVIKNITVAETPRSPVQRKLSAARPDPMLSSTMGANRALSDAASLDSPVGTALAIETPRGRIRSSLMEKLSPFSSAKRSPSVTTLAQDLRIPPAATAEGSNDHPTPAANKNRSRRRSVLPFVPLRAAAPAADAADKATVLDDRHDPPRGVASRLLEATSEAMEGALFELEDIRASRIKDTKAWECSNTHLKQLLAQAEAKLSAATAQTETLTSERNSAIAERREAQEKIDELSRQLQKSKSETAELQAALEKTEQKMQAAHKEAAAAELRLTEALTSAEKQIAELQDMVAFRNGIIMSVVLNSSDMPPEQHLQVNKSVGTSDAPAFGASDAEPPLRVPWKRPVANDEQEGAAGGCPLQLCSNKQLVQHSEDSRGRKFKVVFRQKDDTCCTTSGCLKLWSSGSADSALPLYSLQPPTGLEDETGPSRKFHPHAAPNAAFNRTGVDNNNRGL